MGRRFENVPKELAARLAENPAEKLAEMIWWTALSPTINLPRYSEKYVPLLTCLWAVMCMMPNTDTNEMVDVARSGVDSAETVLDYIVGPDSVRACADVVGVALRRATRNAPKKLTQHALQILCKRLKRRFVEERACASQ